MKDGVGYLDFGATHPDFRRRGGQTALLNTRIKAALDAGCSSIVTMTGEAVHMIKSSAIVSVFNSPRS